MTKRASTTNCCHQHKNCASMNSMPSAKLKALTTVHTPLRPGPRWVLGGMARWSTAVGSQSPLNGVSHSTHWVVASVWAQPLTRSS